MDAQTLTIIGTNAALIIALTRISTRQLTARIDALEKKIDGVHAELSDRIDRFYAELSERIDRVERDLIARIDRVERDLIARIDGVERNVTERSDTKLDTVNHRLRALESDMTLIKDHLISKAQPA